jgi:anti-anti-sigma factor
VAQYQVTRNDRRGFVTPGHTLTAAMVPELQTALREVLADGVEELVFDLAETAMLDSSGMGLLIAAANSLARKHGRIRVINASPDILQLLRSMRLADRLGVSGRADEETDRG